jgi:hypothetical protein
MGLSTMTDYDITMGIWVTETSYTVPYKYMVCPECEKHDHDTNGCKHLDCKNVFYMTDKNGVRSSVAQCQCYSKEHGVRC